jgi:hypothetical protein
LAEIFVFVTASSYVVYEYLASAKKAQKQKDELANKLSALEASQAQLATAYSDVQQQLHLISTELAELKGAKASAPPAVPIPTTPPPELAPPAPEAPSRTWFGAVGAWLSGA